MKILKRVLLVAISLLLIFSLNSYLFLDTYNSSTMYSSFIKKRERADAITSNKVIIIGGSSSNLGFDSKTFEDLSGIPCANLSISAGVPLKTYMRAAEICAKKGDIIIAPLEYEYYADENFHGVTEVYVDMVAIDDELKYKSNPYHDISLACSTFLRRFALINDCIILAVKNKISTQNTIYIKDSVDEYGDFCLHENKAPTYTRKPDDSEFKYNDNTMGEIVSFINKMKQKGVTVYISYPPTDLYRITNYKQYASDAKEAIENFIPKENILGTPIDFAYEENYFFDTPYHLQYNYRKEHTEKLFHYFSKATK